MSRKAPEIVLGLVGKLCAGKGTVINYLISKHDFYASSCSDRIREKIREQGLEVTRDRLLEFGGKLRGELGPAALAKMTWKKITEEGPEKAVVDSIRAVGEAEFLKDIPHLYLVALDADQKVRFERMAARKREADPQTFEEFQATEEADMNKGGRDVDACMQMADFHLENNGTEEDLNKKIDELLVKLASQGLTSSSLNDEVSDLRPSVLRPSSLRFEEVEDLRA